MIMLRMPVFIEMVNLNTTQLAARHMREASAYHKKLKSSMITEILERSLVLRSSCWVVPLRPASCSKSLLVGMEAICIRVFNPQWLWPQQNRPLSERGLE